MTPRHPIVAQDLRDIESRLDGVLAVLEGRSVVITGATGMVAAYLSDTIAHLNEVRFRRPCRLAAVVRSLPAPNGPLGHLLSAPGVRFLVHDARTPPREIEEADFLVLAACKGSPRHYLADPIGTLELNGGGLGLWLELARRLKSEAVLYFSSGEIYGTPGPDAVPTPETYAGRIDPVAPRSVYAEGKRYGETLALAYQRHHGVPVKIVRPFQVFGPGLRNDDGRALPDFLCAAAERRPLVLRSSGAALRTFMYIADATVAFWQVLIQGRPGCVYNVGSPGPELTIRATAERIAAIAGPGCRVEIATVAETSDAPARAIPDISRLENDFGFAPRYGFDELVDRTLRWLRETVRVTA
jgi:UDP-glucuronate decarboxylase